MENKVLLITIDGPAGSGKTTVSKILAGKLGYIYVDTGALYRGIAYEARENDIDPDDTEGVRSLLSHIELKFVMKDEGLRLMSGEKDISDVIRTPEISMLASRISAKPEVRAFLLDLQRQMGRGKRAVFEGRDMGTVIFPDADIKVFLQASNAERALRRYKELSGFSDQTLEQVREDMEKRDHNDATRNVAPLKPADDAVHIDSTDLPVEEVVKKILTVIDRHDRKTG